MTIAALTRRGISFPKSSHSRPFLVFGISGSHSPEAPPVPSQAQMILHKAIHRFAHSRRSAGSNTSPVSSEEPDVKKCQCRGDTSCTWRKTSRLLPLISTIFPRPETQSGKRWSLPRPEIRHDQNLFSRRRHMPSKRERTPLRRQAQPKKYRENILNGFRLFKKFQRVLEKQEHSGRTILRNAKRFNKPDTVHKHAQPIPVRPQTPGPP